MGLQTILQPYLSKIKSLIKPLRLHISHDSGGKDMPTIVLLHGLATTSSTWNSFIKELGIDKFRVIALDLLGFGQSPKPLYAQYTVEEQAWYVRKSLRKIKAKPPYILVGHSMGSLIAAHYSYAYPKEVEVAYLLSMPIYLNDKHAQIRTGLYMKAYEYLRTHQKFTIKHAQRIRKLLKYEHAPFVNQDNWHSFTRSLRNTIEQQNVVHEIENTDTPFFIIYGKLDEFIIEKNIASLNRYNNVNIIKIPKTTHILRDKYASQVAKIINTDTRSNS